MWPHPPMQITPDSTGEEPCSSAPVQKLSKMTKRKNSPQKRLQEVVTANELIKSDLSNTKEQEFRITVIKLIARLEKAQRTAQNLLLQKSRDYEIVMRS